MPLKAFNLSGLVNNVFEYKYKELIQILTRCKPYSSCLLKSATSQYVKNHVQGRNDIPDHIAQSKAKLKAVLHL